MATTFVGTVLDTLQALNRVASLLRGRQFAIDALTLARSEDPAVARLTLVVNEAQVNPQRVALCLDRLEEVVDVRQTAPVDLVCREIALVKLAESPATADWIDTFTTAGHFRVAGRGTSTVIVEIAGAPDDVGRAIASLPATSVLETCRLGPIALRR